MPLSGKEETLSRIPNQFQLNPFRKVSQALWPDSTQQNNDNKVGPNPGQATDLPKLEDTMCY